MSDFLGKPLLKLWNLAPLMRVSHYLHIDFMTTSWWEENSTFIKSKPCNAPLELEKRRLSQWSKHTQRKIPVLQILHQETTQGEEKKKCLIPKYTKLKKNIYQVLLLIKYSNANLVDMRNETKVCNGIR